MHEFPVNATDAGGNVTTYQNDILGRMWNSTTPGGNTTRRVYDPDDRATGITDANGSTTTYTYDNRGELINARDPNLLTTMYAFNLTLCMTQKAIDPGGNTTTYVYNNTGDLLQVIDARNHATVYGYDRFHRQVTATSALGFVARSTYDAAGNQIRRTDANGNSTIFTYDKSNRLLKTTYPNGQTATVVYDKNGNVVEKNGLELDEIDTYDLLDRLASSKQVFLTTSLTVYANFTYDANGNRVAQSGTAGGNGGYTWDADNRLYSRSDASGNRWLNTYDRDGRQSRQTYPDGEYVTYAYNANGWLLNQTTRTSNGTILEFFTYTYDKAGNRLSMTEYRLYQADLNSPRCPWVTWFGGSQCTFDTNPSGMSPSSQTARVYLRAAGSVNWDPMFGPFTSTITWTVKVVNTGGTTTYTLGSITTGGSFDLTKSSLIPVHNGDAVYGNLSYTVRCKAGLQDCWPTGWVDTSLLTLFYGAYEGPIQYRYDKQYRLSQTKYANGTYENLTYDAVGNRLTRTFAGSTVSYTYDADDRLSSSTDGNSYSYDANGNVRSKTKFPPLVTTFSYDYENRLTSVNLTFRSDYVAARCGVGMDCTANADPRALVPAIQNGIVLSLRAQGSVVSTSGSNTITWYYVKNGSAVQMGSPYTCSQSCNFDVTRTASARLTNWDSLYGEITFTENGNTHVTTTVLTLTYAPGMPANTKYGYSSDGLRTSLNASGSAVTYYGYDPIAIGSPPEPVGEFSGGQLKNQTLYDAGVDAPLERTVSGVGYNVHRDGLGSVTAITNTSQALQSSYRYDPYGVQTQAAGAVPSPFRYTGREWDANDGLEYSRARYYDPSTGRFLSKDPIEFGGGTNRYAYAGGNPVTRKDPSGHMLVEGNAGNGKAYSQPQDVPPLPLNGNQPTKPSNQEDWLVKCGPLVLLFVVGLIFAMIGLAVAPGVATLVFDVHTTWALDAAGMLREPNFFDFIGFIFDIFLTVFWSFIAPTLGWFGAMEASIGVAKDLTPMGMALEIGMIVISLSFGIMSLAVEGCL